MAVLPWLVLGAMSLDAPWALSRRTRTGCAAVINENPQQEKVTFP